jgi:hypothetical protein
MLQQPVGTSIGSISARCLTVDPRRYEDNFDAVNNVTIMSLPSDKGSIDSYGSPDKFLEQVSYLFGRQTFTGAGGGCSYPWGCVCGGGVRQVFFYGRQLLGLCGGGGEAGGWWAQLPLGLCVCVGGGVRQVGGVQLPMGLGGGGEAGLLLRQAAIDKCGRRALGLLGFLPNRRVHSGHAPGCMAPISVLQQAASRFGWLDTSDGSSFSLELVCSSSPYLHHGLHAVACNPA